MHLSDLLDRKVVRQKYNICFLYCPELIEQMMKVITTVNMVAEVMTLVNMGTAKLLSQRLGAHPHLNLK